MQKYSTNIFFSVLNDFRFWIALFFIVRLFGISDPPLEAAHNWRQVTVNMVARNFLETDSNIFYPRIDICGEKTGITGMEFPLLNYLIFLFSKLFGYTHWYGRLINLFVSSFGVYYFYLLIKKYVSRKIAFSAGLILLCSIWFNYSRKIMPDTFSVSFIFIGIYYALKYLYEGSGKYLIIYFVFALIGISVKIPSILFLPLLSFPVFEKSIFLKRKIIFLIASLVLIIFPIWWYFYWVPHLVEEYGFWHFYMGTTFENGFYELIKHPFEVFDKFSFDALKFIGFIVFITGIILSIIKKEKKIFFIWLIYSLVFSIFMLKAGRAFYHHSYYIIPYVPVMALMAGFALSCINRNWIRKTILALIIIEGIANQQHDFFIKDSELRKLELESIADKVSEKNDLIVINGKDNPQDMYFAHRKGWTLNNSDISDREKINEIIKKGCRFMFIDKTYFDHKTPSLPYEMVFSNKDYIVYRLI